jgi:hypothetical protein
MGKKTIPVNDILEAYNAMTRFKPEELVINQNNPEEAIAKHEAQFKGVCRMVEFVLHQTGNYKGFTYVDRNGDILSKLDHPEFHEYRRIYF